MDNVTPVFSLATFGRWPNEMYKITSNFNIPLANASLTVPYLDNYLNSGNPLISASKPIGWDSITQTPTSWVSSTPYQLTYDIFYNQDTLTFVRQASASVGQSIYWNASLSRFYSNLSYGVDHLFNYFRIGDINNPGYYGLYLVFPSRLILNPFQLSKIDNKWVLKTKTQISKPELSTFYTNVPDLDAYNALSFYQDYGPSQFLGLNEVLSSIAPVYSKQYSYEDFIPGSDVYETIPITYVYNLKSSLCYKNRNLFTFSDTNNPETFTLNLEDSSSNYIRPNSVTLTYSVDYVYNDYVTVSQIQYNLDLLPDPINQNALYLNGLEPQYDSINLQDNSQLFGITRDPITQNNYLLSAVLHFDTNIFNYYRNFNYSISGRPDTDVTISYKTDSDIFKFSQNSVQDTLSALILENTSETISLNQEISTADVDAHNLTWITDYPPHYYSYKASIKNPYNSIQDRNGLYQKISFDDPSIDLTETYDLDFNLTLSAISISTYSASVSSFISSSFNKLHYNLEDNNMGEYIKYSVQDSLFSITDNFSAFYGLSADVPYTYGDWIPILSGCNLHILCPDNYPSTDIILNATLSSVAGFNTSKYSLKFSLGKSVYRTVLGYPIKLNGTLNYGEVTLSHLMEGEKNLSDSYISWNYMLPVSSSAPIGIVSIDSSSNIITSINPGELVFFDQDSWTVRFLNSELAPLTAVFYSQKFDETSYYIIEPLYLPDVLPDSELVIEAVKPLNNLYPTRTITLKAGVKYQNQTFNLPISSTINWDVSYDGISDAFNNPVEVYYGQYFEYQYYPGFNAFAGDIGEILIKITPPVSDDFPKPKLVSVNLTNPANSLPSAYSFWLDCFPSKNIFNSDIAITYTNFPESSSTILYTGADQYTLCRPQNGTNDFLLKQYSTIEGISPDSKCEWIFLDNASNYQVYSRTLSNSSINYAITGLDVLQTNVTFKVSAIHPNWNISSLMVTDQVSTDPTHLIETYVSIYTIPSASFYDPFEFITFPLLNWFNSDKVNVITPNFLDFLVSLPVAYDHEVKQTSSFYVSANKNFQTYNYYNESINKLIASTTYKTDVIEIPYTDEFRSDNGQSIKLVAYNEQYTPAQGTSYYIVSGDTLITENYNNQYSLPLLSAIGADLFKARPRLLSYDFEPDFSFSLASTGFDIVNNQTISVIQNFKNYPTTSPCKILDNTTVTYLVSSKHWSSYSTVTGNSFEFDLATLYLGNPLETFRLSDAEDSSILIYAISATAVVNITSATFSDVTDLNIYSEWNPVNYYISLSSVPSQIIQISSTYSEPSLYVSNFTILTGGSVSILPVNSYGLIDSNVNTYNIDFGDNSSILTVNAGEYITHNYSDVGTYYISYSANFKNNITHSLIHPEAITVKDKWLVYNQEDIRILSEQILQLPHQLSNVEIQPNEWGDADIFNSAITKLYENLLFLENNSRTINTNFPTSFYGWFGTYDSPSYSYQGIRWFIKNSKNSIYKNASIATNKGLTFFENIVDVAETPDYLFILDKNKLRIFENNKIIPSEISFSDLSKLNEDLIGPTSICFNDASDILYIADTPRNRVISVNIDIDNLQINYLPNVGGFGALLDSSKFNAPSHVSFSVNNLFVLDSNNNCIKEYTKDLNWIYTYFSEDFLSDPPISFSSTQGLIYVLTKGYKVYVFNRYLDKLNILNLDYIKSLGLEVNSILNDNTQEFFYVCTDLEIFKYSVSGYFISQTLINSPINNIRVGLNKHLLISIPNAMIKIQDFVDYFEIGSGLSYRKWSLDQILLDKKNMPSDFTYNQAIIQLLQNIKQFRDSLDSKFVTVSEILPTGDIIYYYSLTPIQVSERPVFSREIEEEDLTFGVNEFHISHVVNRNIQLLYKALEQLNSFMNITEFDLNLINSNSNISIRNCVESFCWSWKGMSDFNLSMPFIKKCQINPISYVELESQSNINYAPNKTWGLASSECCNKTISPLKQ